MSLNCQTDQGNLTQNIVKIVEGEISENDYKPKRKTFPKTEKIALDCYLQRTFYGYIDSSDNKSFFIELKQFYKKENYLRLKNFETRRAISRFGCLCRNLL